MISVAYSARNRHGAVAAAFCAEIHREVISHDCVVPKSCFAIFEGHPLDSSVHDLLLAFLRRRLLSISNIPRTPRVSTTDLMNVAKEMAPTSAVDLHTAHRVDAPQLDNVVPPGYGRPTALAPLFQPCSDDACLHLDPQMVILASKGMAATHSACPEAQVFELAFRLHVPTARHGALKCLPEC